MGRVIGLCAVQLLAFWPVWRWYGARLDNTEEAAAVATALLTALLVPSGRGPDAPGGRFALAWPTALTLAYAAAFPFTPPLVRAAFALSAVGATWTSLLAPQARAARFGLFLLATPALPSLEFFLGYPMRRLVAEAAALWLRMGGLAIEARGVGLEWAHQLVLVDAPCSGVRMLWGATYMALAVALLRGLGTARTAGLVGLGVGASLLGNSLRAAAVFQVETGLLEAPPAAHGALGVVTFAVVAAAIAVAAPRPVSA